MSRSAIRLQNGGFMAAGGAIVVRKGSSGRPAAAAGCWCCARL